MESLRSLRQLVTLAEIGHYRKASAKLGITHSALSQAIKRLEESYSVQIFVRQSGRVVPTAYGELLVETAKRALDQFQETEREIGLIKTGEKGRIVVGVDPAFSQSLVAPALARLINRFPHLRFTLRLYSWAEMQSDLKDKSIDLYIGSLPEHDDPNFPYEVIRAPAPVAVCKAGHPLTSISTPTFPDLVKYPLAGGEPTAAFLKRAAEAYPDEALTPEEIRARFLVTHDFSILPNLIVRSDVVGIVHHAVVANELEQGLAVQLTVKDLNLSGLGDVAIVQQPGRVLPPSAEHFKMEIIRGLAQETENTYPAEATICAVS